MTEAFDPRTRPGPPEAGDERETLTGYLNYQRATLAWKAGGLTPQQAATRSVSTSTMTLLGLIRHMAEVESSWCNATDGRRGKRYYSSDERPDDDFDGVQIESADQASIDTAYANWAEAKADFDAAIASKELGFVFTNRHGETLSIRNLLCHMIEEYARHNGHADLLREAIDGETGE